jgi:hypothetical protein
MRSPIGDVAAVEHYRSPCSLLPPYSSQEACLAGAIGPNDRDHRSTRDLHVNPIYRSYPPVRNSQGAHYEYVVVSPCRRFTFCVHLRLASTGNSGSDGGAGLPAIGIMIVRNE